MGNRLYFAHATTSLLFPAGTADASPDIVPLLGLGEALPTNIYTVVNTSTFNVAMTDMRQNAELIPFAP